jgi:predicted transcriptional regulator
MEANMSTVTISVSSIEESQRRMAAAFTGVPQGAQIGFASFDLLWKLITVKRWHILQAMAGQGELTIREVARRVDRDVKAVHGDVRALLNAGVLQRAGRNVEFPFDVVHLDVVLKAAA